MFALRLVRAGVTKTKGMFYKPSFLHRHVYTWATCRIYTLAHMPMLTKVHEPHGPKTACVLLRRARSGRRRWTRRGIDGELPCVLGTGDKGTPPASKLERV